MSDYNTLLDAIHEQPDLDILRLQLADYLLEYGDESQRARGELIQCQIDNKPWDHGGWPPEPYERCEQRRDRIKSVLTQYADTWRKGPVCEKCVGRKEYVEPVRGNALFKAMIVRCEKCYGSGYAGGLMRRDGRDEPHPTKPDPFLYKVEYVRGMKRVYAILEECVQEVPDHTNNCRCTVPSDWLLSVIQHHPDVIEVRPINPMHYILAHLNQSVFHIAFPGIPPNSDEDRLLAISRAMVRWARTFTKPTVEHVQ